MEKNLHSDLSPNEDATHRAKPSKKPASWTAGLKTDISLDSDFYVTERQIGKTVEMIGFALKCGTKRAFPMNVFDEIRFGPETGISLYSRMVTIKIMGRNLGSLYQLLTSRKVKEVREYTENEEGDVTEAMLFIDVIAIHSDYDEH